MVSAINTALTGLNAASLRLQTAANNIANQHSTRTVEDGQTVNKPFEPQEVVQTSLETGGVAAQVRPTGQEPLKMFSPDSPDADESGFLSLPNVDLERQVVETKLAVYDFKANLKSIDVQDNLFKSTLDIIS